MGAHMKHLQGAQHAWTDRLSSVHMWQLSMKNCLGEIIRHIGCCFSTQKSGIPDLDISHLACLTRVDLHSYLVVYYLGKFQNYCYRKMLVDFINAVSFS